MAEFPKQFAFPDPLVHVNNYNANSIGGPLSSQAYSPGLWPSANRALFVPFRISRPFIISTLYWVNGNAVSGNIDIGIYSSDGTKIISKGSTAQATTNVLQSVSVTSTEIGAGLFYIGIAVDNTSASLSSISTNSNLLKIIGCAQMASAFTLPATATFATVSSSYLPMVGATGRSVV